MNGKTQGFLATGPFFVPQPGFRHDENGSPKYPLIQTQVAAWSLFGCFLQIALLPQGLGLQGLMGVSINKKKHELVT